MIPATMFTCGMMCFTLAGWVRKKKTREAQDLFNIALVFTLCTAAFCGALVIIT